MLLSLATFLLTVWGLGMATSHTLGGYIHVALCLAAVACFLRLLTFTSQSYSR